MMAANWQKSAQQALQSAKRCNDFFTTTDFRDHVFPIKIPLEFANLIDKNNPNDPLLKQVIPQASVQQIGFSAEPLDDEQYAPIAGLIHKYPNRVLLIASQVCSIHCRYCFRQNFNYGAHDALSNWTAIKSYLKQHSGINEVILSGGDPLSLSDAKLKKLIDSIAVIDHIKTVRIHTRSAVVTPSRLTDELAAMLNHSTLNIVVILHVNHAGELSQAFIKNIAKLRVTLLNQSVLLKGVNDSVACLSELSLHLFAAGVLPYYLHMLDKVKGSEYFMVKDEVAVELHRQLKQSLSGYLVPKLVRDNNGDFKEDLSV